VLNKTNNKSNNYSVKGYETICCIGFDWQNKISGHSSQWTM